MLRARESATAVGERKGRGREGKGGYEIIQGNQGRSGGVWHVQDAVEDRSEESVRGDRPGGAEGGRPAPVWQRTKCHLLLFRWVSGQILRKLEFQNLHQRAAKEVRLPTERFQTHSLRIGGTSALYQATGDVELVKRSGR